MGHYILNFTVYTMAMIGLICFALFAYKKFAITNFTGNKKGLLSIEDGLGLSSRKTLYIIKAGNERFLIAADLERTTLISKLDSNNLVTNDTNELDEIDKANLEEIGVNY